MINLIDESGYDEEPNKHFTWRIKNYTQTDMNIELIFDEPLKVSSGSKLDKLKVIFNDTRLIFDDYGQDILNGTQLFRDIPP